ncbi:MAG: hypothetical protein M3P51_02365 [Chloroflexota bacterium]|nr:hypothetical protein [Chloroflexota bacterium]
MEITEVDLAWAAGLFEGEGSVRINPVTDRNWGHLTASVTSIDADIVGFFHDRWGGYCKSVSVGPGRRPAFAWLIAARRAAAFLSQIQPYLRSERMREKVEWGLAFQAQKRLGARGEEYRATQQQYAERMAELNLRGLKERVS